MRRLVRPTCFTADALQNIIASEPQGICLPVRPTRDGVPVIQESEQAEDGSLLQEVSLEYTRNIAKDRAPPLSLSSVLSQCEESLRMMVFLEVRHPMAALPAAEMAEHFIRGRGYASHRIVLTSALHQTLVQIRQRYSQLHTGAILREPTAALAACADYTNAQYLIAEIDILNEALAADAKAKGIFLVAASCDSEAKQAKAKQRGCTAMMTPELSDG